MAAQYARSRDTVAKVGKGLSLRHCYQLTRFINLSRRKYSSRPVVPQLLSWPDDHSAKLCDLRSGECQQIFEGHTRGVTCAEFATEGCRVVTASRDHSVNILEVSSGKEIAILRGHTGGVTSCPGWGPYVASCSFDCTVCS